VCLELSWDATMLDFATGRVRVRTAGAWQVRLPVNSRSFGRWHHWAPRLRIIAETLMEESVDGEQ